MLFPASLGGSSLSKAAFQRLQECPVADPPCADQQVCPAWARAGWPALSCLCRVAPTPPA